MKKILILCLVAVLLFVGFRVVGKLKTSPVSDTGTNEINKVSSESATIEILKGKAYSLSEAGAREQELENGASLDAPVTIEVAEGGLANINFADGSTARVDGGSTFTIKQSEYNSLTGEAKTSIFLTAGRIWSKVFELATPDSSWEVETSNAVATVRGTSFNSIVDGSTVMFTGSENTVAVFPLDPETRKRMEDEEMLMGTDQEIKISRDELLEIAKRKRKMVMVKHKADARIDAWINQNKNQDVVVNEAIEELKKEMKEEFLQEGRMPIKVREKIRARIRERLENFYKKQEESKSGRVITTQPVIQTIVNTNIGLPKIENPFLPPEERGPEISFLDIVLVRPDPIPQVVLEGAQISAKVIVHFTDKTKKDMTDTARWRVNGTIGSITSPGIFIAKLNRDVTENEGSIVVSLVDPNTKELFSTETEIFKVVRELPKTSTTSTTTTRTR